MAVRAQESIFCPLANKNYYELEKIDMQQGLVSHRVMCFLPHSSGFQWIGTEEGLSRFDGYSCLSYDYSDGLKELIISSLLELKNGKILILYRNHLLSTTISVLDPITGKIQHLNPKQLGIQGNNIKIKMDGQDCHIISSDKNQHYLYEWTIEDQLNPLAQFKADAVESEEFYDFESVDKSAGIYIVNAYRGYESFSKMYLIRASGDILHRFGREDFDMPDHIKHDVQLTGYLGKNGNGKIIYKPKMIACYFYYNPQQEAFVRDTCAPFVSTGNTYYFKSEDYFGNHFIRWPNGKGLQYSIISSEGETWDITSPNIFSENGNRTFDYLANLSNNQQLNFLEALHVASLNGLVKIKPRQRFFQQHLANISHSTYFSARGITAAPDGQIVFSSQDGDFYQLNPTTNRINALQFVADKDVKLYNNRHIAFDQQGNLWTMFHYAVNQINWETKQVQVYPTPEQIYDICLTQKEEIWVAGKNDLYCLDKQQQKFIPFFDSLRTNFIKGKEVTWLSENSKGELIVGTNQGLFFVNVKNNTYQSYYPTTYETVDKVAKEQQRFWLKGNNVLVVHEISPNEYLIGYRNHGLQQLHLKTGKTNSWTQKEGLPNNSVCGILADDRGNFWVATFNGLSFLNTRSNSFRNYFEKDGLSHNEFNRTAFFKSEDGTYYFGGLNGLVAFKDKTLSTEKINKPLLLSQARYYSEDDNRPMTQYFNPPKKAKFTIPAANRNCSFHFALADYHYTKYNTFYYQLEKQKHWLNFWSSPSDTTEWTFNSTNPEINFNYLPSGHHKLKVKAINSQGITNKAIYEIDLSVKAFFYQSSWFLTFLAGLFCGMVYAIYRYQLRQAIKLERMRTRISSDLHDEVGGLLSGVAMQMDLLEHLSEQNHKARIRHIGKSSRHALSKMRDVVWAIDARKDTFGDLVERLQEHAMEVLAVQNIHFKVTIKNLESSKKIPSLIRQNVYLIFKEAITNVAKHAGAKEVTFSISKVGASIEIRMVDDGQGLRPNLISTGQGLSNMKMRAIRINGILEFLHREGFGILLRFKA